MQNGKLTSIIIVNHNNGQGLIRTLSSLESLSSRENFEVVVVDCGSTDDTEDLINRYRGLSPNLDLQVVVREGIGPDEARSIGSKVASGNKYLMLNSGEKVDGSIFNRETKGRGLRKEEQFPKPTLGIWNHHINQLGGGTIHSFKFTEYLRQFYDVEMHVSQEVKNKKWMKKYLNLDSSGIEICVDEEVPRGFENDKFDMFLNISHWRIMKSNASRKWSLVFFPQFEPNADFAISQIGYRFLANSEYTKENIIEKWSVQPDRIEVVYPPIMVDEFSPGEKENIILNVARFAKPCSAADKGQGRMIETFKRLIDSGLDGWEFHLVGEVQSFDYYVELLELAQGYPIFFHKGITFEKLKNIYAKAKILWHMTGVDFPDEPGAQEHFGMTLVEAMASGAVPISLNRGGPNETIKHKKTGFLVGNTQWLGRRTMTLVNNPDKLEKMSIAGLKRANRFSEDSIKEDLYSAVFGVDKVSIIILCHNNLEFTKECITALFETTPKGFELILVDNASTDGTLDYLNKVADYYGHTKVISNKKNLGFAEANNKALKQASGEYICYLNNDTEAQHGWLMRLIDVLDTYGNVGIVGARMYFDNERPEVEEWRIQHAGIGYDKNGDSYHIGHHKLDSEVAGVGVTEVASVTGACMLVRRELAEFNEAYERGYYEDNDLCLSAKEESWRVCVHHGANLIHHEGKTQNLLKKEDINNFEEISEKNRELFLKKWRKKIPLLV